MLRNLLVLCLLLENVLCFVSFKQPASLTTLLQRQSADNAVIHCQPNVSGFSNFIIISSFSISLCCLLIVYLFFAYLFSYSFFLSLIFFFFNMQRVSKAVKAIIFRGKKMAFLIFAQNIDCGYTLEPQNLCSKQNA